MKSALLPQLNVFLTVARLRGFTAAARELGVTTAAVSHSVRQLEEQLGVVLLARTTRSVALTDAGRRLDEGAGPGLRQAFDALKDVSAEPGEVVGRLRLTVPGLAVPLVITPCSPRSALATRGSRWRSSSRRASWTSSRRASTPACG